MAVTCEECPLRRLDAFVPFTAEEVRYMRRYKVGELSVEPRTTILLEGSNSPQLFTVLEGMGLRYVTLPDDRRQVLNFLFPGDFVGLQAGILEKMGHSVEATSRMTLCVFDRNELWSLFKSHPERGYDLTWLAATDEKLLGDTLATVGQRPAAKAVAWALLRIFHRGQSLELVDGASMPMPFRQQDLADALGLSLVHTNKTLAALRERQLVSWQDGVLSVRDVEALAHAAGASMDGPDRRPLM